MYKDEYKYNESWNQKWEHFNHYLIVKKGGNQYRFVREYETDKKTYEYGDIIEVEWTKKLVNIDEYNDEKTIRDYVFSTKKIESGNVSNFLDSKWITQFNNWGMDILSEEVRLLTYYYLANSKNELIEKFRKEDKQPFSCYIEKINKGNKKYYLLGIILGSYPDVFKNKENVIQWLLYDYSDRKNEDLLNEKLYDRLYEYDILKDKLLKFKD